MTEIRMETLSRDTLVATRDHLHRVLDGCREGRDCPCHADDWHAWEETRWLLGEDGR